MAETDALLYLPHRDPAKLRLATTIPALSPGWQGSFRELLAAEAAAGPAGAGLGRVPAAAGDRGGRGDRHRVVDLPGRAGRQPAPGRAGRAVPDPADHRCRAARPGTQLLALVRTGAGTYRISVKAEPNGTASSYLNREVRPGAMLEAARAARRLRLDDGAGPVLLLSAGIGVTPVLAMLHALADAHSTREVWWVHSARERREDPLAAEAHALLAGLPHAREHLALHPADQGRPSKDALAALGVPADATAYVCGPDAFMADMRQALTAIGIEAGRIRTELFGALAAINPGITGQARRAPHQPDGPAARPAGDVRAQRDRRGVRHRAAQRARAGRRVRRAQPVELPVRRLPHLRHAAAGRPDPVRPGPAGAARRRRGTDLLRAARHRHRAGHVGVRRSAASLSLDGPARSGEAGRAARGRGRGEGSWTMTRFGRGRARLGVGC